MLIERLLTMRFLFKLCNDPLDKFILKINEKLHDNLTNLSHVKVLHLVCYNWWVTSEATTFLNLNQTFYVKSLQNLWSVVPWWVGLSFQQHHRVQDIFHNDLRIYSQKIITRRFPLLSSLIYQFIWCSSHHYASKTET